MSKPRLLLAVLLLMTASPVHAEVTIDPECGKGDQLVMGSWVRR